MLLTSHFPCFSNQCWLWKGVLPRIHKPLTSNGVGAYVPPDTHIVDRITADTISHHKGMLYVWEGRGGRRYHTDRLSAIPRTVVLRYYSYFFRSRLFDGEKQPCQYRRHLGGDGDAGAVFSKNLRLWSHIVVYYGRVTTDANL